MPSSSLRRLRFRVFGERASAKSLVRAAYRGLLGREPDSGGLRHYSSLLKNGSYALADLLKDIIASEEFRAAQGFPTWRTVPVEAPPLVVETSTDPEILRTIVAKTADYWEAIGKTAPHFSVLTFPDYTPDRINEMETHFFETGKGDLGLLLALLRRIGHPAEGFRRCLEFGCGVGRVTAHLATTFNEVVALDVSRSHLQLAQAHMRRLGHTNVSFLQVTPEDLHPGANYDLWFSRLVLQHNPPPVTLHILDKMFTGLLPLGMAVIHVPTYISGYNFNIRDYLASNLGEEMEMHALPQKALLELAWRHGCCLLDVREEPAPETEKVTNIFVFQKRDLAHAGML